MGKSIRTWISVLAVLTLLVLLVIYIRGRIMEPNPTMLDGEKVIGADRKTARPLVRDEIRTGPVWPVRMGDEALEAIETQRFGVLDNAAITKSCEDLVREKGIQLNSKIKRPEGVLKNMLEHRHDYYGRTSILLDDYKRLSQDPPEAKAMMSKAIETYLRRDALLIPTGPADELRLEINAAVTAGATDPFAIAMASMFDTTISDTERAPEMMQCAKQMEQLGYSPEARSLVAFVALMAFDEETPNVSHGERYADLFAKALCDDLADCDGSAASMYVHCERVAQRLGMLRIDPLLVVYQRIMEDDRINEALVNYMAGTIHINMAWVYRTSRVASAVTEEGWMRFNYHLERARVFLKQSWKLQPDVPHAAAGLITVAKANVEDWSARHWFVLSVRAQFSFGPAYSNYMDAIQPKWGGSEEELVEFGRECLATRAFGTIVPMQAFYAISSYADDVGRDKAWKNPDVIELTAEYADAFDEWLKTDERKQDADMYLEEIKGWMLAVLLLQEDNNRAGRLIRNFPGYIYRKPMDVIVTEPDVTLGRALVLSGPQGKEFAALDAKFYSKPLDPDTKEGEFDAAESLLATALEEASDPFVKRYLQTVTHMLPELRQYCCSPAKACNIKFRPDLFTQRFLNGHAEYVSPEAIRLKQTAGPAAFVTFRHRFRRPYRIRCSVELPAAAQALSAFGGDGDPPYLLIAKNVNGELQSHKISLQKVPGKMDIVLMVTDGPPRVMLNRTWIQLNLNSSERDPAAREFDGTTWVCSITDAIVSDVMVEQILGNEEDSAQ
ncbi:MAG: hypothetical protein U0996_13395 [Planctomycetaceae bacterium]